MTQVIQKEQKKRKLSRVFIGLGVFALLFLLYLCWQAWDINRFGHSYDGEKADCAIVLGAAAYHNKPSPVFKERIRHGIDLHKNGSVKKIILTGGYGRGAEFAESEVAKEFCLEQGIAEEDLLFETKSLTTESNLSEAKSLMDQAGLSSALIVSDPWHLKRACVMAKANGIQAMPSATLTSKYESDEKRSKFILRELYFIHQFYIFGE